MLKAKVLHCSLLPAAIMGGLDLRGCCRLVFSSYAGIYVECMVLATEQKLALRKQSELCH